MLIKSLPDGITVILLPLTQLIKFQLNIKNTEEIRLTLFIENVIPHQHVFFSSSVCTNSNIIASVGKQIGQV